MGNKILNWMMSKFFIGNYFSKEIIKTDWMTKILELCRKNSRLHYVWDSFITNVVDILKDGISDAEKARNWK